MITMDRAMSSKLEEATANLDIKDDEVAKMKKHALRRKLMTRIVAVFAPLLSFIGGYAASGGFVTKDAAADPPSSYPYAAVAASAFHYKAFSAKTRVTIWGTIVVSTIAFIAGFVIGRMDEVDPGTPVIMYGVYDGQGAGHAG